MLPLVERNVPKVGIITLVDRECHHLILLIVERNLYQGLPLVDSGYQGLLLVDSGDQELMDPIEQVCLPLVDRDW